MYIFSIFLLYVVSLLPVIRANGTSCDEDELNLALCHAAFRVRLPSDMEIQASQDSRWVIARQCCAYRPVGVASHMSAICFSHVSAQQTGFISPSGIYRTDRSLVARELARGAVACESFPRPLYTEQHPRHAPGIKSWRQQSKQTQYLKQGRAGVYDFSCAQGPHIMYTEWGKKYGKVFKVLRSLLIT